MVCKQINTLPFMASVKRFGAVHDLRRTRLFQPHWCLREPRRAASPARSSACSTFEEVSDAPGRASEMDCDPWPPSPASPRKPGCRLSEDRARICSRHPCVPNFAEYHVVNVHVERTVVEHMRRRR